MDENQASSGKPSSPGSGCNHTLKSYPLTPLGRVSKPSKFYIRVCDSQKNLKGQDLFFLKLFLQVVLFQAARDAMLGQQSEQAVL